MVTADLHKHAGEETTNWEQRGFVVISDARIAPLLHAFVTTEWEAKNEEAKAAQLPPHLRISLCTVPAVLKFSVPKNTIGSASSA